MKWLILIALILLIIVVLGFVRFRRQIQMAWQFWQMYRQMRQVGKPQETLINKQPVNKQKDSLKDAALVRCEKCGKWTSPETALKLRQDKYYCSSACMERAAKLQSLVD